MPPVKLTPEILADLEEPVDVRLSPDGQRVVYTLRNIQARDDGRQVSSLWLAEVNRENTSRQITSGFFRDSSPQFSPDGRVVAFLSDRAHQVRGPEKGEDGQAIYVLPLEEGGEAWSLTDTKLRSGVEGYRWSPDGRFVAYMSADEESAERKRKSEAKDDAKVYGEDWQYNRLRVVDVGSKEVRTLVQDAEHVSALAWSLDGSKIVFCSYSTPEVNAMADPGAEVKVVDVKDRSVVKLCGFRNAVTSLAWQGTNILWTANYDQGVTQSAQSLHGVAAAPEKESHSYRAGYGVDCDAAEVRNCVGGVVVKVIKGLADQLHLWGSDMVYSEEQKLLGWDAVVQGQEQRLAVIKGSTGTPAQIFSVVGGKWCQLSQHSADIAAMNIGSAESFCLHEDGKMPIDGVLCTPSSVYGQDGERKPHKTFVLAHGGPYDRINDSFDISWNWAPWLLSLGYVVLCPNYRGSSSRGNEYAKAALGNAEASYPDVIALVKKGIDVGIIDKDRVVIGGWSQGGYLSYLAVTRDSTFHFSAAICGAGVSDWDSMVMSSDAWTFEADLGGSAPWSSGGAEDIKGRSGSPIYFMQNIQTPVLILHGEDDRRVPVSQATGFHRGMLAKGKECEMVLYPREEHSSYQKPWGRAHYVDMLKRIETFLAKHV